MNEVMNEICTITDAADFSKWPTLEDRYKPASLTVKYLEQQNSDQHRTELAKQRPDLRRRAECRGHGQIETKHSDLCRATAQPLRRRSARAEPHYASNSEQDKIDERAYVNRHCGRMPGLKHDFRRDPRRHNS